MERLTMESDKGGLVFTFYLDITWEKGEIEKIAKLGQKLKDYEDIGLEPEEIQFLMGDVAVTRAEMAMKEQQWIPVSERFPEKAESEAAMTDGEYFRRIEIAVQTDTIEYHIGYFDGYK